MSHEREPKREELLQANERKLQPIAEATQRTHQPLGGVAETGMRMRKVINHYEMGKHPATEVTSDSFSFRRDEQKIAAEQAVDERYIVRSKVEPQVCGFRKI